ncbi:hypothetical protein FACS18949_12820 [Clostridia bacterium]|nr:hypothetical protein FACS18949_12820 [Clostridia bacterium]
MCVADFVYRAPDCVKQRSRAADLILSLGYRADRLDVYAVVEQFVVVVEKHSRDNGFPLYSLLFGEH